MRFKDIANSFLWSIRNLLHAHSGVQDTCRFVPTCSGYAIQAIENHGVFCGLWLATKRLLKCHPWGKGGLDLVPPIQEFRRS